jgi:hypothetical protein
MGYLILQQEASIMYKAQQERRKPKRGYQNGERREHAGFLSILEHTISANACEISDNFKSKFAKNFGGLIST